MIVDVHTHFFRPEKDFGELLQADLARGLGAAEAAARLARHGPNALPEARQRSALMLFPETKSKLDHSPVSPLPTTTNIAKSPTVNVPSRMPRCCPARSAAP